MIMHTNRPVTRQTLPDDTPHIRINGFISSGMIDEYVHYVDSTVPYLFQFLAVHLGGEHLLTKNVIFVELVLTKRT